MKAWLGVTVAASLLVLGGRPVWAHAGFEHFIGTVAVIDTKHIEIRTGPSSVVSLEITGATRYLRKGAAVERGELTNGIEVVIDAQRLSGILTAKEIRLVVPATKTTARTP